MPAKLQVTTPSDTEIVVTRSFDAPRSLVWDAFTRPELVQRWLLGPPGWTMPVCEIDLRIGGRYRYRWRSDKDGNEFEIGGQFNGIRKPEQLDTVEKMEGMPGGMSITTSFHEQAGGTRVVYYMTCDSKATRDASIASGMTDGMELSFQNLDDVLAATA